MSASTALTATRRPMAAPITSGIPAKKMPTERADFILQLNTEPQFRHWNRLTPGTRPSTEQTGHLKRDAQTFKGTDMRSNVKVTCDRLAAFASVSSWAALQLGTGDDIALVEGLWLDAATRGSIGAQAIGALIVDTPPRLAVRSVCHDLSRPLRAGLGRWSCWAKWT
jgi:hypothetical protein